MIDEETPAYGIGGRGRSTGGSSAPGRDLTGLTLGEFQVQRLLGRGGMGEVYLARQVNLDREVALKVLKPELLTNPTYLARFEKEALTAAKLNHPNVVHVYSFGGFDNLKYIAMEYVNGTNLKDFLAKKGKLELPLAFSIMRQSSLALAAAGELGLVHRDIKPENLLLTRKGQVKVADFGLCRDQQGPDAMALTQEGITLGTPMYMSPEQVQGKDLDPRSDLYSLGVTFYHMLSGMPPFTAESPLALAVKQLREEPVNLAVRRPELHPDLVALVMKLMSKAPGDRLQSAGEVLRELARIRDSTLAFAATASVEVPAMSMEMAGPARLEEPDQPPRFRGPRGIPKVRRWQLAGLVLAAYGLGTLAGLAGRSEDLLSPDAPQSTGPPGLWLADWQSIPPFPSAEEQYRYALLKAPPIRSEAAWLAVAGRYPNDQTWGGQAQVQLLRLLFRRGDAENLGYLSGELRRSSAPQAASMSTAAQAGISALRGDPQGVLDAYNGVDLALQGPALNEVGFEIVQQALRDARDDASLTPRLQNLRTQLAETIQLQALVTMGLIDLD